MSTPTIVYEGDRGAPVRIAPLDPDAVLRVTLDVEDWLRGETLSQQKWHAPAGIVVGDGAATKLVGTGELLTPPPPDSYPNPLDGRTLIEASIWRDLSVELEDPPDVVIPISLSTPTRGDDRSVVCEVRDR